MHQNLQQLLQVVVLRATKRRRRKKKKKVSFDQQHYCLEKVFAVLQGTHLAQQG